MDRLFSPWRSAYLNSLKPETQSPSAPSVPSASTSPPKDAGKSIFADLLPEEDEANLVVHRGTHAFIIMNLYPYNAGHLLVIPYRQTADLAALNDETKLEMMQLIDLGIALLQRTLKPHGFNVGLNLGSSAGGSVETHLHFHIVPRWSGDTNFMPVLADTKVISSDMTALYHRLRTALAEIVAGK